MPSASVECIAGAVAGVAQDALMHPVDTLRARLDVTAAARPAAADGPAARVNPLRELHAAAVTSSRARSVSTGCMSASCATPATAPAIHSTDADGICSCCLLYTSPSPRD